MADDTFANALAGTWLPFVQMGLNQKNQERQAIRDQANLIFQQERQKAIENHYMDMAKHQAATELQASINQKFKQDKDEKDAQRKMYTTFTDEYNDLTEKGGKTPGEAFVKAMAKIGMKPGDQEAPPPIKDFMDSLWKDAQAKMPVMPTQGAGTAVMPQNPPPQLMPGMPGGGAVGVPQPAPFPQGPPIPGQDQPGMMAPNVNIQPAMTTAPPSAFPQSREQWTATHTDPAFALKIAAQKAKDNNVLLGQQRVNIALANSNSMIDHRKIDDDLRKSNYASLERNRQSLATLRNIIGKSIPKNDAIKQRLADSITGFRDVEAAKLGLDVLNNWDRLDQGDRRLWNDEAKAASTEWNNLKNQVGQLNNELNTIQEIENKERNSRTWPEDVESQDKLLAPLVQRRREIDELLHGHMIVDPTGTATFTRDPQNPGAIQQMEDARVKMQAIPSKAETAQNGKPKSSRTLPPPLQKAIKGFGQKPVFGVGKVKIYNPQTGNFE